MYMAIALGAHLLVFGATAWLLVGAFRSTRSSGYLVLLAGLLAMPLIQSVVAPLIIGPAIEALAAEEHVNYWPFSLAANGTLTVGELLTRLGLTLKLFESGLVLLGLWLVVRDRYDPATPGSKHSKRTGTVAPAAEPQPH